MVKFNRSFFIALAVFVAFFSYYNWTSNTLRIGAGPDYQSHNDAVRFIYQNYRLAVFPDDENQLTYSAYGGSRTLRPPFPYIVSAILAHAQSFELMRDGKLTEEAMLAFRKGSVLLASLTLVLSFYALWVYFGSYLVAIFGTILFGLMPQFTFIASYNNDDSGAIFSASALLTVLILIFRRGLNLKRVILLGTTCGLVILSKPTAWLLAPLVLLFVLFFVRLSVGQFIRWAGLALILAFVCGGWWLAWNVYHYGLNDPVLMKVTQEVAERHQHFSTPVHNYHELGVKPGALIFLNYDQFMTRTFYSFIGNLDWLRLRLSPVLYTFYGGLFLLGLLGFLAGKAVNVARWRSADFSQKRQWLFELMLLGTLVFQFAMYIVANEYNDIQIQGKYLLPVWLALWILVFRGFQPLAHLAESWLAKRLSTREDAALLTRWMVRSAIISLLTITLLLHFHSLFYYVQPYYRGVEHEIVPHQFEPLNVQPEHVIKTNDVSGLSFESGGFSFMATGTDPYVVLDRSYCRLFRGNRLLKITMESQVNGRLRLYWMNNTMYDDINPETPHTANLFYPGLNEIYLGMASMECPIIRFDFGAVPGKFRVLSISSAQIDIDKTRQPDYLPF